MTNRKRKKRLKKVFFGKKDTMYKLKFHNGPYNTTVSNVGSYKKPAIQIANQAADAGNNVELVELTARTIARSR